MAKVDGRLVAGVAAGAVGMAAGTVFGLATRFVDVAFGRDTKAASVVHKTLVTSTDPEQVAAEDRAAANRERIKAESTTWMASASREDVAIVSRDGLRLHGAVFAQPEPTHLWAVLVHGFRGCIEHESTYIHTFYQRGFNVLAFDHRGCGLSEGEHISMGWYERLDLLDWLQLVLRRDPEAQIVLHGISMGATTILLALGEDVPRQVCCAVADCAFTSLYDEYADKLSKALHLPPAPLLRAADVVCQLRFGFTLREVDGCRTLARNATPVLYIHGDADDYNPYWMMTELFGADACPAKEQLTVPRARHAAALYTDPEAYLSTLDAFLAEHLPLIVPVK